MGRTPDMFNDALRFQDMQQEQVDESYNNLPGMDPFEMGDFSAKNQSRAPQPKPQ
jgi:hypothetical protein